MSNDVIKPFMAKHFAEAIGLIYKKHFLVPGEKMVIEHQALPTNALIPDLADIELLIMAKSPSDSETIAKIRATAYRLTQDFNILLPTTHALVNGRLIGFFSEQAAEVLNSHFQKDEDMQACLQQIDRLKQAVTTAPCQKPN